MQLGHLTARISNDHLQDETQLANATAIETSDDDPVHEIAGEDEQGSRAGPFSLLILCETFRQRVLSCREPMATAATARDMLGKSLQALCETAAETEAFPQCHETGPVELPPKQQVLAAVGQFLQYSDCVTDIFVPSHLMANLETVYAHPQRTGDSELWATCFKTITLLVLGVEINKQQSPPTFVGDFARSMLPSRITLLTPRLLASPKLVNIQILILLVIHDPCLLNIFCSHFSLLGC